jgi:hypothetical protein
LLLSPIRSRNIFTADASDLIKVVKSHHIPITPTLTVGGARHAIISHLITGSCVASCESPQHSSDKRKCLCADTRGVFESSQAMSHHVLSVLTDSLTAMSPWSPSP